MRAKPKAPLPFAPPGRPTLLSPDFLKKPGGEPED